MQTPSNRSIADEEGWIEAGLTPKLLSGARRAPASGQGSSRKAKRCPASRSSSRSAGRLSASSRRSSVHVPRIPGSRAITSSTAAAAAARSPATCRGNGPDDNADSSDEDSGHDDDDDDADNAEPKIDPAERAKQALRAQARANAAELLSTIADISRAQRAVYSIGSGSGGDDLVLPRHLTTGKLALREHQRKGVTWIWKQWQSGLGGCILADDMGLGKTAQALAVLVGLFERHRQTRRMRNLAQRNPTALRAALRGGKWPKIPWLLKPPAKVTQLDLGTPGPHLVIAPTSLVSNWLAESRRFAGMMKCTALVGSREERKAIVLDLRNRPTRHNIVVTSFSMLDDEGVVTALKVGCHRARGLQSLSHPACVQHAYSLFNSLPLLQRRRRQCQHGRPLLSTRRTT